MTTFARDLSRQSVIDFINVAIDAEIPPLSRSILPGRVDYKDAADVDPCDHSLNS